MTTQQTLNYRKACACDATSSGPRMISKARIENRPTGPVVMGSVTYEPGPVCDGCDTPWVIVEGVEIEVPE